MMYKPVRTVSLLLLLWAGYTRSMSADPDLPVTQTPAATVPVAVSITGTVSGETGEALPGVSVLLKGTSTGTVTDVAGKYKLTLPDANGTLVFSYIGYVSQEVPVTNRSVVDVQLISDTKSLAEVVVVGYGAVKKSDVTGALVSVDAKQIQSVPVQNLTQALQGRAAGVDIAATDFRPGSTPAIRIRGNRSLRASNDPLYVVDGIPLAPGTGISDFNQLDVQSVEILKDASATAIYGSRGSNGVILVTTKKGKAGTVSINYDGWVGFDNPLVKLDNFDAAGLAEVRREAYRTVNTPTSPSYGTLYPNPADDAKLFGADPYALESIYQGYEWDDYAKRIPKLRATTAEEQQRYGVSQIPIYNPANVRGYDWVDAALRTGVNQSHQLSMSGGSEKLRALFSGGYLKQEGIQLSQDYSRFNARLSLDYKYNDRISVGGSVNATYSVQNFGVNTYNQALGQLPFATPYDTAGNYIFLPGGDINIVNPILDPSLVTNERRSTRLFGSFYGEVKLFDGLRYRLNFGPDLRSFRNGEFQAGRSSFRQGGTSYARYQQDQRFSYTLENLLFYDKTFSDRHTIGLTLLQSISDNRFEGSDIRVSNLPYDSQKFYNVGSTYNAAPDAYSTGYSDFKLASWMGRINYTLFNRYLFTATARYDGSSVLADGNKGQLFPSFAFAWKVQEESFLRNVPAVSELKLRLGYGTTGNAAVDPYQTGGFLNRTAYVWDETPAYGYTPAANGLPNPGLKWERTSNFNAGIDFGLFNNRLTGTVDLYRADTKDLLLDRQLPAVSGFTSILTNIGATRNQGVEISLSSVNMRAPSGFEWRSDVIFTKNKEQIVELSGGKNDLLGNRWFIGQPISVFYDYKFDGVFQNTPADLELIAAYKKKAPNSTFAPGKVKVADINGDSLINASDQVIRGTTVPKWSGSITNTFSYKGFELSVFVYARVGQTLNSLAYRPGLSGRYPFLKVNYWTPTNPSNEFPQPNKNFDINEFGSSLQYQDGTFVKVRSISLTYTFPKTFTSRFKGNNLSVYVNSVNPFLFTKFKALDPEFTANYAAGQNDLAVANNLSTRSLVFGVRFGF